ncbi:MAG: TrbC/VirB2 family protein [Hyphomonadaceae bacterium]|nr:TrbC/VirB2 family protein [Hyphomonadaceae bacterium]
MKSQSRLDAAARRARRRAQTTPVLAAALAAGLTSEASAQAAGGGILQPVQGVLQEIVTTLTGPLGVLVGALCLVGIGVLWATGRLDVRAAVSSIFGIALIGTALVVAEAVFAAAGA